MATNRPGTLDRVSDDRLADLAADRTGWDQSFGPAPLSIVELLSMLDELRAWRRHKLTDAEKGALRELANGAEPALHADAIAAIDRIVPKAKETP